MSQLPLPRVDLTWTESSLSHSEFLYYDVYRRSALEPDWLRIARIYDRTVTGYGDDRNPLGVQAEYTISQSNDQGGNAVESDLSAIVQVTLRAAGAFLHAVADPSLYASIPADAIEEQASRRNEYQESYGQRYPDAQSGPQEMRTWRLSYNGLYELENEYGYETYARLRSLLSYRGVLMLRQNRGIRAFVRMDGYGRSESLTENSIDASLTEVDYPEGIG